MDSQYVAIDRRHHLVFSVMVFAVKSVERGSAISEMTFRGNAVRSAFNTARRR
jgi:hypothetical protein